METGKNTLQHAFLRAWWHHNCVSHCNVYFSELLCVQL